MALQFYRLEGHTPVPCSHEEWCRRFDRPEERRVAETWLGTTHVSSVFLGHDQSFGLGPPQFIETIIFSLGSAWDEYCWRWATWGEAAAGHARIVARLQAGEEPEP